MNKCRLTMMFIALLLAVTSAKALTQDVAGNYLIGSVQDWIDFAEIIDKTNTGANARMTSDVDLGDDQTHIGYNENKRYCGIFDGGGHRLIVKYNSSAYGLAPFRYTAGATIKNMHIDGSIISTYSPESHTSGVISHSKGEDVISNVWVSVDIQSGGSGWIECAAFIGCNNSGSSTITDCLFTGSMKTTSGTYNGCFVGYCDTNGYATVNNCLSIGTFDYYGNNYVGNVRMTFSNCYVKQFPSSIPEAMQVTDDQLANGTTVGNLNNGRTGDNAPWVQEGGQPMLKLFALQQDTDNYYLLSSASHWKQFANIVKTTPTANAKMIADIELKEGDNTRIGDTRQDIESGIFYQGVFDGQGHTLTVHYNVTDGVPAPFTHINGATIKNLHVAGTINTSLHHSSVVAHVRGGTNLVSNIWSSLDVITSKNSWDECSAIVSWMGNATLTIEDCLFTGSITCTNGSSYNGCFIGWHQYDAVAQIKNCLSTGTFNSTTDWDATRGCPHTNCYIKQFPASIPTEMQVTDENLSNGTTTTALNGERTGDDAPWVQYGDTPMLKIFYSKNLVAHEGDVTGVYWTTFFCSDKNYKINDAEEATAYTATLNGSTITLHTLNKDIPKNMAVIIKGEDDEISMNIVSDPDLVVPDNDLHGVDVQTNTDDIKTALGDGTLYVLGYTNSHFGFHKYTGTTMPAHKAFLLIDGSGALLSNTLDIDFGDGTTGVESIKNGKWIINNYYDLSGRCVENPTKGLYIVNGKKVIIK